MKLYQCKHCGNIIYKIKDSGIIPVCCNETMQILQEQTSDGALEKHVPMVTINKHTVTVQIGYTLHPMLAVHHIEWIILKTNKGIYIQYLQPGQEPIVDFTIDDKEEVLEVLGYCNLHGLYVNK